MDTQEIVVKLSGEEADAGYVPAFAAFQSLEGFAQAQAIILHYARTGEVRRRRIKELEIDLRFVDIREGSFEVVLQFPETAEYLAKFAGTAIAGGLIWDLSKAIFRSATGVETAQETREDELNVKAGDLGALVQAIEPSIRKTHNIINNGSKNINIYVQGDSNTVNFDGQTKSYMLENIFNEERRSQRFLITSFDGRERTGRAFDLEAEQAFTFDLVSEADRRSLEVIVEAARQYALRQRGQFNPNMEAVCAFTSIDASDGRTKRLKIFAAREDYSDFGEDEVVDDDDF